MEININQRIFDKIYHKIYAGILDFIFQERCLGCQAKNFIICQKCADNMRRVDRDTPKDIYACYDYRDPLIKKAIWKLKYSGSKHLGEVLGKLLYESMLEDIASLKMFSGGEKISVIPVPLSRERFRRRGYNQAEIIAKSFCDCDKENLILEKNLISKKSDTIAQAKISNRVKRIKNIKNAFLVNKKELVTAKTIIVIDDVTTTGATLLEIIKILKSSSAKRVLGYAIAH